MSRAGEPRVSVVIPARNEGGNLIDTVGYVLQNSAWINLEVIVVDDGSQDDSITHLRRGHAEDSRLWIVRGEGMGVAGARNRGAEQASGDVIVFLDGHCYVPDGWLAPLVAALDADSAGMAGPAFTNIRDPRMRACGVTWGDTTLGNVWLSAGEEVIPVPFHIGACQAVNAAAFRKVGGYDRGMTQWGSEDIELCLRMWLFGYRIYAQPSSLVYHLFRTSRPYAVDVAHILYNHLRMALLHFDRARLARVIARMVGIAGVESSLARAYTDDTLLRRHHYLATRSHDMDWFCAQFGIEI
jgi:GT2 family glycosyltransferase